jgi:hypothetical protein
MRLRRSTPAPILDVGAVFPILRARARVGLRLHPRRGPDPGLAASKMGGPIVWPAGEAWPVCSENEVTSDVDNPNHQNAYTVTHDEPYVPVLQLRKSEIPEMPFPWGADVMQLLWCPHYHGECLGPICRAYWRSEAELRAGSISPPAASTAERHLLPRACVLYPERVTEYPAASELTHEARQSIHDEIQRRIPGEPYAYERLLSCASGTKAVGHPDWIQDPEIPTCGCGSDMEYMLTIASYEWSVNTVDRWCPIEDRVGWDVAMAGHGEGETGQTAAGLYIGDCGSVYLFVCRACKPWRTASVYQCS